MIDGTCNSRRDLGRPLDARAAIQGGLRHQSDPLPHDATARSGAARDPPALLTCRGIARCRILRPEPHDADVHARLRGAARTMGRSRRDGAMSRTTSKRDPHLGIALRDATRHCSAADVQSACQARAILPDRVYEAVCVGVSSLKWKAALCQNCVTYTPTPRANTATYVDALKHIVVPGSC